MISCEHVWIQYTPLIGMSFECCSKCPMTKAEYDKQGGGTFKPTKFTSTFASLIKPKTLAYDNSFHGVFNAPAGRTPHWGSYTPTASIKFTLPIIYHSSVPEPQLISSGTIALAVGDWLLDTDPKPGDNFCGVDRSVDTVRLAGIRYDGSKLTIEEAVTNSVILCAREGANPESAFLSPNNYKLYCLHAGPRVQHTSILSEHGTRFDTAVHYSPYGKILMIEDVTLTDDKIYLLTLDTWFYCPKQKHVWTTNPGYNCVISL